MTMRAQHGAFLAAFLLLAAPGAAAAPPVEMVIACTNPASGAAWRLTIDFARSTVDGNPARITAAAISWFDKKDGGNYTLDRRTGALTGAVASSTGGYFRRGRCTVPVPR